MKKIFKLENLDCANCAAKMERQINQLDGVNKATISFMTQKMSLDADEAKLEFILNEAAKICKKVDSNCTLVF